MNKAHQPYYAQQWGLLPTDRVRNISRNMNDKQCTTL